jgi:hypothetical protein
VAKYKPLLCCVCAFTGVDPPRDAVTVVKGYRTCLEHFTADTTFFRDWESAMDPHTQTPKAAKKLLKQEGKR